MARLGSVRLRFGGGTVRAVSVFISGGSSGERVCLSFSAESTKRDSSGFGFRKTVPTVPVPLSVS